MPAAAKQGPVKGVRPGLAALAATVLAAGLPAHAGPPAGELLVQANQTASTVFRVTAAAHIVLPGDPASAVLKTGHYAGLLVYRGRHVVFGVISDDALAGPLVFGDDAAQLTPGVYSALVVADAPAQVDVPLSGAARSYSLVASGPAAARRTTVSSTEPAPVVDEATAPVAVTRSMTVAVADSVRTTAAYVAGLHDLCLANGDGVCVPLREPASSAGPDAHPTVGGGGQTAAVYAYPGDLKPGTYHAIAHDVVATPASSAHLVVYRISTP